MPVTPRRIGFSLKVNLNMTTKRSHKIPLLVFSLLFLQVIIIVVIASRILVPGVPEEVRALEALLWFALGFPFLILLYCLRSQGSERQLRIFWAITLGVVVSGPFAFVGAISFSVLLGLPRNSLFLLFCPVGFAVGMVIGNLLGERQSRKRAAIEKECKTS